MNIKDILDNFYTDVEKRYQEPNDTVNVLIPYLNKEYEIPHRYKDVDFGLILKVYEQNNLNTREELIRSIAEEIINLVGDTDITNDIIQELGSYYLKDFYSLNLREAYRLVRYDDIDFRFWKCDNPENGIKTLRSYIAKNYNKFSEVKTNIIVLSKGFFFDDSSCRDREEEILVNKKNYEIIVNLFHLTLERVGVNFVFYAEDLDINLLSRASQINLLKKSIKTRFDLKMAEPQFDMMMSDKYTNILNKLSGVSLLITKEMSDKYFYIGEKVNGKVLYYLIWCILKYSWSIVFEDPTVESRVLRELHSLYVHNYDIISEQIKYLKTLVGQEVVITRASSYTNIISEAKITNFTFNETVRALKVKDLMTSLDNKIKSNIIKPVNVELTTENILFTGDVLADIFNKDKEKVEEDFLKRCAYNFESVLINFAQMLTYTITKRPINISDLIFVKVKDEYYVTCLQYTPLRLQVAMYCDKSVNKKAKVHTVPLDCVMPKYIYPIFRDKMKDNINTVTDYYIVKDDAKTSKDILDILRLIVGDNTGNGECLTEEQDKAEHKYYKHLVNMRNHKVSHGIDYKRLNAVDPEFIKTFNFTAYGDFSIIRPNDYYRDSLNG